MQKYIFIFKLNNKTKKTSSQNSEPVAICFLFVLEHGRLEEFVGG